MPQPIALIARSLRRFMGLETSSGILLLLALAAALAWANSPWGEAYFHLLETPIGPGQGSFSISMTVHHFINDALMAVFFFVVGLEIKREMVAGELAGVRKAAFPAIAALGGMLVPALLYAACNVGRDSMRGWGIPMATDIPFALGVLSLLGNRVPGSVRIFLMALAIIDDLGAVLVIAIFYSQPIDWGGMAQAAAVVALLFAFNRAGMRGALFYALPGALLWYLLQKSGIHGTIAGVIAAWAVPARARHAGARSAAHPRGTGPVPSPAGPGTARDPGEGSEGVRSPLQGMIEALHPWTAFGILPLFAFANAGVRIEPGLLRSLAGPTGLGIFLGLVVGKPLGIFGAAQAMMAFGFPRLSGGVGWKHMLGAGMLGGIGFTMSIFISGLAFGAGGRLDAAKVAVFLSSAAAGILGFAFLRALPSPKGTGPEGPGRGP